MEVLFRNDCGYSAIASDIISRLNGFELYQLSRVSKGIRDTVFAQAWEPQRAFSRHFKDFRSFCDVLVQSGAIVSGSSALGFFDGTGSRHCGDVDVFLYGNEVYDFGEEEEGDDAGDYPRGKFDPESEANLVRLGKHVINAEGYEYILPPVKYRSRVTPKQPIVTNLDTFLHEARHGRYREDLYETHLTIKRLYDFARPGTSSRVQVVVCSSSPERAVLYFHSTVVCNIITGTHAISIFPRTTFKERQLKLTNVQQAATVPLSVIEKYIQRGWGFDPSKTYHPHVDGWETLCSFDTLEWCIQKGIGPQSKHKPTFFSMENRCIGDKESWILPLFRDQTSPLGCRSVDPQNSEEFLWFEAEVKSKLYTHKKSVYRFHRDQDVKEDSVKYISWRA